jgi:hypothetical protein
MSYSRWGNSTWYTFWTGSSPDGFFRKKEQAFEICDVPSYTVTYQEIVEDVDGVIARVKEFYSKPHEGSIFSGRNEETGKLEFEPCTWEAKDPSDEELEELKGYMLEFVENIDHRYRPWEYFKYEVYYHYRNRLNLFVNRQLKRLKNKKTKQ